MGDVDDPSNIAGIGKLLNYQGSLDIAAIERSIISGEGDGDGAPGGELSEVAEYDKRLRELEQALGSDLSGGAADDDEKVAVDDGISPPLPRVDDLNARMGAFSARPSQYAAQMTEEQKRQRVLGVALGGDSGQQFSVEHEKEEDEKTTLLEEIDMLLESLRDEGISTERVPNVSMTSPLVDIQNVHKILRHKNDRSRYCSFAEESILGGAQVLEWLFDGKKTYLGRHPDLTGWNATVAIKLRRMRYDTSTFVSEVMQSYHLSHGMRIMLELVPSLMLHSSMRKSQRTDNLVTSDEMTNAMNTIQNLDQQRAAQSQGGRPPAGARAPLGR